MAIYKSSLHSPNLEEVDLNEENQFSCVVNTSGESVLAYKMQIIDGRGNRTVFDPKLPTQLAKPIKNKELLKISGIKSDMEGLEAEFANGSDKNYQWAVRTYNAKVNSTAQPNTLVCEGYLVGSTKYVIWCKIANQDTTNKDAVDQIVYDRYIEFDTVKANMCKGAKDDVSTKVPDTLRQRRKIDWVTRKLGYNEDFLKIETTENFDFNYVDGTAFKIFQCSDEHTLKSFFVDPNSNINVSDYVVLFKSVTDAKNAHDAGYTPSLSDISGDSDPDDDTGVHTATNIFGSPQKVLGYSSDTGEIRVGKSYTTEPVNGYAYLIFEYDAVYKTVKEITPTLDENATTEVKNNPYLTQVVGGRAISNNLYKVATNRWDNTAKRLFIQPNINIKPDDTNPNEIVFGDGTRIDIAKQYWTNNDGDYPVKVDITFDQLDNTQWLLTTDSEGKNESGQVPSVVGNKTPPIIPQTDYKVYTDFMDSMPFNIFYARNTPDLKIQYRDLNKQEKLEKDGEEDEPFTYFNGLEFKEDLERFFLEDEEYKTMTLEYINSDDYPTCLKEDYLPSIANTDYYNSVLEMVGSYNAELVAKYQIAPSSIREEEIEVEIELLYEHYNAVGIPLRNIQFYTEFTAPHGQGIKYYHYYLYAYKDQAPELIAQSDDIYNTDLLWSYRGFLSDTKYAIKITIMDEYDKEFEESFDFNIFYGTEKASAPLEVEYDCNKKAIKITATSPEYVVPTLPNIVYLSEEDKAKVGKTIILDDGQICYMLEDGTYQSWDANKKVFRESSSQPITEDNIYRDDNNVYDDYIEINANNELYYDTVLDDDFPNTKVQIPINFSYLTQFQITPELINGIPFEENGECKTKIAGVGYEYFDTDKYKVNGVSVNDIIIEEVKYNLPTQPKSGDIKYLICPSSSDIHDRDSGYYIYVVDTEESSSTYGSMIWRGIKPVEGILPDASVAVSEYNSYCHLVNSTEFGIENGCYQYNEVDETWKLLPELCPEKTKLEYYNAIGDIFVLSDGVNSTKDKEYQWLDSAWREIMGFSSMREWNKDSIHWADNLRDTIYKIEDKYYHCLFDMSVESMTNGDKYTLTLIENPIVVTYEDELPNVQYIFRFNKEITCGGIAYSTGNYLWNGYIFINTTVEEITDIATANLLEGECYYFSASLDSNFSNEVNAYFITNQDYQNVTSESEIITYFTSLRGGKKYQNDLIAEIYEATVELQVMTTTVDAFTQKVNAIVASLNDQYNAVSMSPNVDQKGTYYDGNYYAGYYLWGNGSNNTFKTLYLFLNSCVGFKTVEGVLLKNGKRGYLEIYDTAEPDNNTQPLSCFVVGQATNGTDLISDHVSIFSLGGNIPAPENYKYAIQDNSNNEYQFASTLNGAPREGEKHRIYSLTEKELSFYLERGAVPPTEDESGNAYGVYSWSNEYSKWTIEGTDYGFQENVDDLIGYNLKDSMGKSYDNMTTEERYNYLGVPENCRSRVTKDREFEFLMDEDKGILSTKPKKTSSFSDPLAVIATEGEDAGHLVMTDANTVEDNWVLSMWTNDLKGNTAMLSTKKEGDLLWTDGNITVEGILPEKPQSGFVYHLINSENIAYPDGYYKNTKGVWSVNWDSYYYRTVNGVPGYYIWESWYDEEGNSRVTYMLLENGTPNGKNIWVDNSAYSYNQLINSIGKVWITMYLTVTYNESNPIRCIMTAQDKWEG